MLSFDRGTSELGGWRFRSCWSLRHERLKVIKRGSLVAALPLLGELLTPQLSTFVFLNIRLLENSGVFLGELPRQLAAGWGTSSLSAR